MGSVRSGGLNCHACRGGRTLERYAEAGFDLTSILHPSCPQIATKSPYFLSLSACLNFGRASSSLGIRTTFHFSFSLLCNSWFHLIGSPRRSTMGFDIV